MRALAQLISAIAVAVVTFPFAVMVGLLSEGRRKCTPQQLAGELARLGAGDMSGWDRLECGGRMRDPRLEAIRQEAMAVSLPFRPQDQAKLAELSQKAARLS